MYYTIKLWKGTEASSDRKIWCFYANKGEVVEVGGAMFVCNRPMSYILENEEILVELDIDPRNHEVTTKDSLIKERTGLSLESVSGIKNWVRLLT